MRRISIYEETVCSHPVACDADDLAVTASAESAPIEIDFWHAWGSGANYEALTTLVNGFNEANEGKIHVNEQFIGNYAEILSKYNSSFRSGDNPTVSLIDACMSLNEMQYGTMVNLTQYIAENDPEYDISQFVPAMLVFSTDTEGNVWSFPYGRPLRSCTATWICWAKLATACRRALKKCGRSARSGLSKRVPPLTAIPSPAAI